MAERTTAELVDALRAEGQRWREQVGDMPLFDEAADALEEMKREMEARELHHFETETAMMEAGLIECPHWSPGRITIRKGCTACEASGGS